MNKNILILVSLGLMAGAAVYSVILFNRIAEQKKMLADKEKTLSAQLDSNKTLKAQLTDVLKQLREMKPETVAGASAQNEVMVNNVEKELKNINEASIKLNEPAVYQQAKQLETEAFDAITKNQFETALAKFNQIESISPSFHSTYEISKLLNKKKADWNDPEVQQTIKTQIVKNYSWKAPAEQLKTIERQVIQKEKAGSTTTPAVIKKADVTPVSVQPAVKPQQQVSPVLNSKKLQGYKTGGKR